LTETTISTFREWYEMEGLHRRGSKRVRFAEPESAELQEDKDYESDISLD
jgi:hypothetical protein